MNGTGTMGAHVEEYLALRRRLGFALRIEGEELGRFARFSDAAGHRGRLTTELAVRWATLPNSDRLYHARRLDMVRRLARHLALFEPATEIPPEGMLGPSYRRRDAHIYSPNELAALFRATLQLGPTGGLRPHTYRTLFGLLACTGLRISEALRLSREHVDLQQGLLTIAEGKFHKSRLVPLHTTTTRALVEYADRRDRRHKFPLVDAFFVSERGTSLKYIKVITTFGRLRRQLGWKADHTGRLPRIHDLRHSFAVRRLLLWYEQDVDVNRQIAMLSTYLGHVKVSDTYWYLTAVPELLAVSAAKFERRATANDAGGWR